MTQNSTLTPHETGAQRPPGIPPEAQQFTLAKLCKLGDIPKGPRGSYMLMRMRVWPVDVSGKLRAAYFNETTGEFSLEVFHFSRWRTVRFSLPGAGDRAVWVFTVDQQKAERSRAREDRLIAKTRSV